MSTCSVSYRLGQECDRGESIEVIAEPTEATTVVPPRALHPSGPRNDLDRFMRWLVSRQGDFLILHAGHGVSCASQHDELVDVLSEFARTMVTDFPIEDVLDHVVGRIVDVSPVTADGVTLISPTGKPQHVAASSSVALKLDRLQSDRCGDPA